MQFAALPQFRVLCCGGDGTIGWVLSVLDRLRDRITTVPPVGIIPLGTGNDLSRCLGWGGGYSGQDLNAVVAEMLIADVVPLDRWSLAFKANDPDVRVWMGGWCVSVAGRVGSHPAHHHEQLLLGGC